MTAEGAAPLPAVPGFRLLRPIGRGGSSTVYLAEQEGAGFSRQVALKLLDREVDPVALRRMREEQRLLARLEHPGIARLYDAGVTPAGKPYLAMEHVAGETIVGHCLSRRLPLQERLELFLAVLDAVAYAHAAAVVHRDLKPAHILVTARGEAKLLDFGLAKEVAEPGDADETLTLHRALTPAYASPEQVRGERVTAASDVYSLGVVLYELLTGTLPYRLDGRRFETYSDAIRSQEPDPPSEALARTAPAGSAAPTGTAAREWIELRRRCRALRGDLDSILLQALRKETQARYASVAALAEDLRRFLAGRPVLARRGSLRYRAARFLRRHRGKLAAAAVLAGLLLAGALLSPFGPRLLGSPAGRAAELAAFAAARPADPETGRLLRAGADRLAHYQAQAARDLFRRAALQTPASALAWDGLAQAERELGEVGRADAAARRASAVRDAPGNGLPPDEVERLRARGLAAERRWRDALPAARALFARRPARLDVGLDLVAALVRTGRTEEAAATLRQLRRKSPRSGPESDPRLDLAEAEVAHRLGEYQRAAALADSALARAAALHALPFALRAERLHGDAIARLDQRAEARRQLESVAARADAAGLAGEAAPARLALGILLLRTAGNDEARAVLERAAEGYRATEDARGEVAVQSQLAMLAGKRGELEEGIRALRAALATARAIGDRFAEGAVLANLIILLNWADEEGEVDALLAPTLAALRDSGNRPVLISALANSTINAVERVDLARAEGYIEEAEGLAGHLGSVMASASVDRARAYLEHTRGNDDLARQRYGAAIEKARRAGVWMAAGSYLADLAAVELATGHPEAAGQRAREAIDAFQRGGDPRQAKNTELVLAWVDAKQGRAQAARRKLAEVRRELAKQGDAAGEFGLLSAEAKVAEALGEWQQAIALRRKTVKMASEWKAKGLLIDQQVGLARALAGAGERKELETLARRLLPELERLGLHGPAKMVRGLLVGGMPGGRGGHSLAAASDVELATKVPSCYLCAIAYCFGGNDSVPLRAVNAHHEC